MHQAELSHARLHPLQICQIVLSKNAWLSINFHFQKKIIFAKQTYIPVETNDQKRSLQLVSCTLLSHHLEIKE